VLNASGNGIKSVLPLAKLKEMQALILSSNAIPVASGISGLIQLNTLVLSKNRLESIGVSKLVYLEKLSLSHNEFRSFPDISALQLLKELRLNDNKIQLIPESIHLNARLVIVDVGNNRITSFEALQPLGSLQRMTNLNLMGNVVCTSSHYPDKVFSIAKAVKILDGRQLAVAVPKEEPAGTLDRQAGASRKTGKKQKIADLPVEALEMAEGGIRLTHTEKMHRKKSKNKTNKGSHAITVMDTLTSQLCSQSKHTAAIQSKKLKSTTIKRHKEGYKHHNYKVNEGKPLKDGLLPSGSNEDDTVTQHSYSPSWVAGPSMAEGLSNRQNRKRKWITEGMVLTGVEPDQKGKLAKCEIFDEDVSQSRTKREPKMQKERHSKDTRGKPALKSRDSGVVAIKEIQKKQRKKSKHFMFKPDVLLHEDFGVGGTSAW
jgi:hypothetical protein